MFKGVQKCSFEDQTLKGTCLKEQSISFFFFFCVLLEAQDLITYGAVQLTHINYS